MTTLISVDQFRKEARGGERPPGGVFRVSTIKPKALDDGSRKVRFCFSDGTVDRMGDTIDPNGWDTADFDRNPVALWSHDASQPPIGRASNVAVEGKRLMGDIEFAAPEVYEFADTVFKLVIGGFLNAVSVGFIPTEYSFVDNDPDRGFGIDFKNQILAEISVCPIPANPQALVEARAAGINTRPVLEWAERTLDGGGKIIVPKAELEALRKAAAEPKSRRAPVRRSADGASESDPASGGALVATCARSADDECGLKNPQECEVHRSAEDEKRLAALISKAVTTGVVAALKKAAPKRRRKAEGDDPDNGDEPETHEECVRAAHAYMKSAAELYDEGDEHHDKAMDFLDRAVKSLDDDGEERSDEDGEDRAEGDDEDDDAEEKAAARRRRKAQRMKARIA